MAKALQGENSSVFPCEDTPAMRRLCHKQTYVTAICNRLWAALKLRARRCTLVGSYSYFLIKNNLPDHY
eukprot:COSAG04_NODE_2302_length_4363_cov_4.173465_5_plen_69_part_00